MPRFDESAALRWTDREAPALVLFVSHRWETVTDPDPRGRTLRALRRVLAAVDRLGRGLDPDSDDPVPDLRAPAMLHASVIQYRRMAHSLDGARSLDDIAVFFDHSCLPQTSAPADLQRLRAGLACLPEMLVDPRVTVLALRSPEDRFETRAWCVAEANLALSYEADRPWSMTFPLRIDLDVPAPAVSFEPLVSALDAWNRGVCGRPRPTRRQFTEWIDIVQLCVDWHDQARDEATAQLHHTGGSADRSYGLYMNTVGLLAERCGSTVDLAEVLTLAARATDLHCSKPDDVVLASLLILGGLKWDQLTRAGNGAPDGATDRWRECLRRFLAGRSLCATIAARSGAALPEFQFVDPR